MQSGKLIETRGNVMEPSINRDAVERTDFSKHDAHPLSQNGQHGQALTCA